MKSRSIALFVTAALLAAELCAQTPTEGQFIASVNAAIANLKLLRPGDSSDRRLAAT